MLPLALALAILIGVSLGLLGGGGSILTVPILVYVLGFEAKQAIAMSLAVVGVTSLAGAGSHWRDGNVHLRVAGIFGVISMAGTYLGARLAVFMTGEAQLALFAVVMLAAAGFMFRDTTGARLTAPVRPRAAGGVGMALTVVEALAVGVLTGLVGVGGGFLIVPALVLLAGLPMKQAIGTSLVVIAAKSFAGFAGYLGQVQIPWGFMSLFTAFAASGIVIGSTLSRRVSQLALKRAFAILLLLMGSLIFLQQSVGTRKDHHPQALERPT